MLNVPFSSSSPKTSPMSASSFPRPTCATLSFVPFDEDVAAAGEVFFAFFKVGGVRNEGVELREEECSSSPSTSSSSSSSSSTSSMLMTSSSSSSSCGGSSWSLPDFGFEEFLGEGPPAPPAAAFPRFFAAADCLPPPDFFVAATAGQPGPWTTSPSTEKTFVLSKKVRRWLKVRLWKMRFSGDN